MQDIILIGAGGHAMSVVESVDSSRQRIYGFVDAEKTGSWLGLPILGREIQEVPNYKQYHYLVAIGDVFQRREYYQTIQSLGLKAANIIDSTAIISPTVVMGVGNYVGKLAIINAGTVIGNNNLINTKALLEHNCQVENHTNISTNTTLNGDVVLEDGVFFGSCSVSNGQLRFGEFSIVGSGSVVIGDVEPHTTVVGAPARVIKKNGRPV